MKTKTGLELVTCRFPGCQICSELCHHLAISGTLIQKLLFQKNSIGNLCKLFHDVKIPPISTYSVNLKTNMKDENYKNFNISRTK